MMVSKLCFFISIQKMFSTGSDPKPHQRKIPLHVCSCNTCPPFSKLNIIEMVMKCNSGNTKNQESNQQTT